MIYLFKTNVLRNSNTEIKGKLSLRSSYSNDFFNMPDKIFQEQEELEKKVLEAKEEYKRVIEETELKKQEILNEANENSKVIEKKAYELGYEQGLKNGYEDGYKESYEQNIEKAIKESEEIKQEGYNTLLNIKNEAKSYIKENKESIINISISIAEQVLREKFKDVTLMEAMAREIFNIDKEGPKPRKDFAKWDEVKDKIFYFFDELFYNETAEQVELPKTLLLENAKAIIEEYAKKFTFNIGSQENWFEELKVIGAELGYCANRKEFKVNPEAYKGMISDVAGAVRSALSHRTNTPDLYTIMQIIGEEKVRERFNRFLEL